MWLKFVQFPTRESSLSLGIMEEEYWQQIQTALNMVLDFVP